VKLVDGWWVPDVMTSAGSHLGRCAASMAHLQRVPVRRVAVQAGGHVGTYPRALAEYFGLVYTFEPEAENFRCLCRNLEGLDHVFAARGVLGNVRGRVDLKVHPKNTGRHQVIGTDGDVPVYRVDDLALGCCDALFLDVEGFEVPVLEGARKTLERCRPLVVAEENVRCRDYGRRFGDIEAFLAPFGYRLVDRQGEDIVMQATS
jgi:FkbM family methyltransferase